MLGDRGEPVRQVDIHGRTVGVSKNKKTPMIKIPKTLVFGDYAGEVTGLGGGTLPQGAWIAMEDLDSIIQKVKGTLLESGKANEARDNASEDESGGNAKKPSQGLSGLADMMESWFAGYPKSLTKKESRKMGLGGLGSRMFVGDGEYEGRGRAERSQRREVRKQRRRQRREDLKGKTRKEKRDIRRRYRGRADDGVLAPPIASFDSADDIKKMAKRRDRRKSLSKLHKTAKDS